MQNVRVVILDYGLVLCRLPKREHVDRMANLFGVDHSAFWSLYERNRGAYDKGDLTPEDYWQIFSQDTSTQLNADALGNLQEWDIEMWSTIENSLIDWTKALRARGYKTALLSNLHPKFVSHIRKNYEWLTLFDFPVFSSEVHLIKPDPEIFYYTLQSVGVRASEALFIDDRDANIQTARSLGIAAILYKSVSQLHQDLTAAGFPYLPTP